MEEYVNFKGFKAFKWNIPLPRPGLYLIMHLATGRFYVGISINVRDRASGHANDASPTKLRNAIKKYGKEAFLYFPAYYTFHGTSTLAEVEAEFIAMLDSIQNGFNVAANHGGVGPYGEAFSNILREAHKQPELRERMAKIHADPKYQEKRRESLVAYYNDPLIREAASKRMKEHPTLQKSLKAAWAKPSAAERREAMRSEEYTTKVSKNSRAYWARKSTEERKAIAEKTRQKLLIPEINERLRAAQRAGQATPEAKARKSVAMKLSNSRPEVIAKNSASVSNLVWITDGISNKRVPAGTIPSEGWHTGRTRTGKGFGPAPGNSVWITNGEQSRLIKKLDPVPVGWKLGRVISP